MVELSAGHVTSAAVCTSLDQVRATAGDTLLVQDLPLLTSFTLPKPPVAFVCRRIGPTSHLAVAARSRGLFCAAAPESRLDGDTWKLPHVELPPGTRLSLSGTGLGDGRAVIPVRRAGERRVTPGLCATAGLELFCNADCAADVVRGLHNGAHGVGSVRLEHIILASAQQASFVDMVLSGVLDSPVDPLASARLVAHCAERLAEILSCCLAGGVAATIRLLDINPVEWLTSAQVYEIAVHRPAFLAARGIALARFLPDLYFETLTAAVCRAVAISGLPPQQLTVIVPFVTAVEEIVPVRAALRRQARAAALSGPPGLGVMIETPEAVHVADALAAAADCFILGTNDLSALVERRGRDVLMDTLDVGLTLTDEVVTLLERAVRRGRASNARLTVGICGEAARQSANFATLGRIGVDFVSPAAGAIAADQGDDRHASA